MFKEKELPCIRQFFFFNLFRTKFCGFHARIPLTILAQNAIIWEMRE